MHLTKVSASYTVAVTHDRLFVKSNNASRMTLYTCDHVTSSARITMIIMDADLRENSTFP